MANRLLSGKNISYLLTAACTVAALTACDPGANSPNKQASDASNKAARIARSAGEPRPTDALIDAVGNEEDRTAINAIAKDIAKKIHDSPETWKTYLEQKSIADDLATANKYLTDALASPEVSSNLASVVQAQLGATASQQTDVQVIKAETQLLDLLSSGVAFQLASDYVANLGVQATAEESRAKAEAPADTTQIEKDIETAKADTAKRQEAADTLETQIKDKQAKATQIYVDTDAALAAADALKGNDALAAARKAIAARKEADSLGAEVINDQLALRQLQMEASFAKVEQTRLESQLASIRATSDLSAKTAKAAGDRAAFLRAQAKSLLEGDNGLAAKYKAFADAAAKINPEISKAAGFASAADTAYSAANKNFSDYQSEIAAKNLDPSDPLSAVLADTERAALLKLLTASSKIQIARVKLLSYSAARVQANSADAMNAVYKAAGDSRTATSAADVGAMNNDQSTAESQFRAAADLAKSIAAAPARGDIAKRSGTNPPSKWLALVVEAVALHGQALSSADQKTQRDLLTQASRVAGEAKAANPFLDVSNLTAAK